MPEVHQISDDSIFAYREAVVSDVCEVDSRLYQRSAKIESLPVCETSRITTAY